MSSTLPNGTVAVGATQTSTDATDITKAQVAVAALIASMTGIEVKTDGADYLVIGPTAGDMRWLLTFGAGTKVIDTAQRYNADVELTPGHIWLGFSYDSGVADITNLWDGAANPFGAADFSGFVAASGVVTVDNVVNVLGSTLTADGGGVEELTMWFRENAGSHFGFKAGASIAQNDDDIADGVTNRIYGIFTTQGAALLNGLHSVNTAWPGFSTSTDNSLALSRVGGAWVNTKIVAVISAVSANLTSPTGRLSSIRYHVYAPTGNIGWHRNLRVTGDMHFGGPVTNDAGTPIGHAIAYSTAMAGDAMAYRTGTP